MSTSTPTTAQLFQELGDFYTRRLLLNTPLYTSPDAAAPANSHAVASETYNGSNTFDANVVMVLSVLLCALICSLGINSIIRCAFRCSNLVASQTSDTASIARLANTGIKRKALRTFPTINYSPDLNLPGLDTECVICLAEFAVGERVRLLPKCNHGFHVKCIDKWLGSHSSCPTCRHSLIETCQKIVGCSQAIACPAERPVQEIRVNIAALEPEGLVRNYRNLV
ncbi:RING-H2 finger protein ATL78-like [Mercurialis annua]|uniref:RING-H2 finger protein ATL78-like n=1 Tax=Mercurialis annua TaxID=3986 RepID=UPI00215EBA13|nr:RING-H2 finger protein ATL78-like [Mercurialis annua]